MDGSPSRFLTRIPVVIASVVVILGGLALTALASSGEDARFAKYLLDSGKDPSLYMVTGAPELAPGVPSSAPPSSTPPTPSSAPTGKPEGKDIPCTVTAYYLPPKGSSARAMEGDETTATGVKVHQGVAAADRRYFHVSAKTPSRVYVPGHGIVETVDVGGAIKGPGRLDIWVGEGAAGHLKADAWGVKHLTCTILPA